MPPIRPCCPRSTLQECCACDATGHTATLSDISDLVPRRFGIRLGAFVRSPDCARAGYDRAVAADSGSCWRTAIRPRCSRIRLDGPDQPVRGDAMRMLVGAGE